MFPKTVPFIRHVKKYGRNGQAADDNIIWRMPFACWLTKVTDTRSEYVIIIAMPRQQWLSFDVPLYMHCLSCTLLILRIFGTCGITQA